MPIDRSTPAGCIGRPDTDCLVVLYRNIARTSSRGICGWFPSKKKSSGVVAAAGHLAHLGVLKPERVERHCIPCLAQRRRPGNRRCIGARRPNLSPAARRYLERLDLTVEDLFHHVLAVLHDPAYRQANAGALRMEWPRIPLPGWPELSASAPSGGGDLSGRGASRSAQFPGGAGGSASDPFHGGEGGSRTAPTSEQAQEAAQTLAVSAARGRELARLLDSDTPVPGVTTGPLRPEDRRHRRARHHPRPQHDRRRLRRHRRLGPFRVRRGRHARPGPRRRTGLHPSRAQGPGRRCSRHVWGSRLWHTLRRLSRQRTLERPL